MRLFSTSPVDHESDGIFQVYKVLADQVELMVHCNKSISCGACFRARRTKQGFTSKKEKA